MDVISNTAENRNKCDDLKNILCLNTTKTSNASNINIEASTLFTNENKNINTNQILPIGDRKNIDVLSIETKVDNIDETDKFSKNEESNFILYPKIDKSVEDKNDVKESLDNSNIYNSDNLNISNNIKSTCNSDTFALTDSTAYTTKKFKSSTTECHFQDINKISPNEPSDTYTKALLYPTLDKNFKSGPIFSPFPSNSFSENVCNEMKEVENTITEQSSKSDIFNQTFTTKNNDQHFSNRDTQNLQPNNCILIDDKFQQVYSDNSYAEDSNKINTDKSIRTMESYKYEDNMMTENTVSTFNNSNTIGLKDIQCLKNKNINNVNTLQILKTNCHKNEPKKHNDASIDTNSSTKYSRSFIQQNFKNQGYVRPVTISNTTPAAISNTTPVAISNTNLYQHKSDEEVSSSNIDRKNVIKTYTKSNSSENQNNKIFDVKSENLENNNLANSSCNTISNNLITTRDKKDFIPEIRTNEVNSPFSSTNYERNSYDRIQLSQPSLVYENYKIQKQKELQNVRQDQYNLSSANVSHKETGNSSYNNYYKISYTENKRTCGKPDSSLGSWNKDDAQRKNNCEYTKIMQPKTMVNSLINGPNSYNFNATILNESSPKFSTIDNNVELSKDYQYNSSGPAVEPLLSANKSPPYVNTHNHTNKYLTSIPSKNKSLTQLQMNPPDFSKISLTEFTQKENENLRNTTEYNESHKKKIARSVTSQNFEEISKKFNYIKDLQLKNPSTDKSRYKESLKKNFEPLGHNSYSNLYVKTPDFSAENVSTCEKNQNINTNSNFNANAMSNDLPTIVPNILNTVNYTASSNGKPTIAPNVKINAVFNNTSTINNELYNSSKIISNHIETTVKSGDEYYQKKCRVSDNSNQYYSLYPFPGDEHLTATYQSYNEDINVKKNPLPNVYSQKDEFSQNYFHEVNNYRNYDGNKDYNIKRTTSVIQSGKHLNLDHTSNFMNSRLKTNSAPVQIQSNWNNKQEPVNSPQQETPNCACRNSPSLNANKAFANAHPPINIACGWQTKPEKTLQQGSSYHEIVQNTITNRSQQNSTFYQNSQKDSPLTKSKMKQFNKPQHLPLDIPQNSNINSYGRISQSYYNPVAAKDEFLLSSNPDKNNFESMSYKQNTNKLIEYNNTTHLHTDKTKHLKTIEYSNSTIRPAHKYSSSSSSKCAPETPRILQKPNYREMINHVYAMRNSTTEDDLNLQIIKRTLNCDISLRKSENDLSQNIFDSPASKKTSSTCFPVNNFYYPRCDEKTNNSKNQYNVDNTQSGYTDAQRSYQEQPYNMPLANNDISVTLSKITKSKEAKHVPVDMKNNINLNSDYPKAVITKVISKEIDNTFPVDMDCIASRSQITSSGSTTKKNLTAPLDLSVKTVKTIADSTGCGDGSIYNRMRMVECNRSAPKFVFQPNFSNTRESNNERNKILHSVTSSVNQKNTQQHLPYPDVLLINNDAVCPQELNVVERKRYSNKIEEFPLVELNNPRIAKFATQKITHYGKDQEIGNKIKSNLSFPSSAIDLRTDESSVCTEYQKEHIPWQQAPHNIDVNYKKNIPLPMPQTTSGKLEHKFQKVLKICNNSNDLYATNGKMLAVQDFNIAENSQSHKNISTHGDRFLQRTRDSNSIQVNKQQIDNNGRNQNKIVRNNNKRIDFFGKKDETIPQTVEFEGKIDVDLSIKKRFSDVTKHTHPKKIRVDDIYRAHLEETSKQQTKEGMSNNFIVDNDRPDIPAHLDLKYSNTKQMLFDADSNPELGYNRSQKLQKKIWYPPIPEAKHQEKPTLSYIHQSSNKTSSADPVDIPSISLSSNPTIHKGADQNVISKLKNSIEMRENEKQKLAKLAENNERTEESSKSDIASLLAARIRTKGELKGFHPPVFSEIKNVTKSADCTSLDVINTKDLSVKMDYLSEYEQNSALDLLDWRSACNDFVQQLKCGTNKKQNKKLSSPKIVNANNQLETDKSFTQTTPCNEQGSKNLSTDSSDEDKPLLLLRQQNYTQANNISLMNANKIAQTTVCKETILQSRQDLGDVSVNKSTHSSIVEKLSEKIGRNIREKLRIEQEKRLAARLGKTSSSESEDNKRNPRQKKISKMTKSRISNGISTRELSDTDSSGTESISMSKNLIRSRKVSRKRKYINNLENVDLNSQIRTMKTEESNTELAKVFSEKQVMTKAEMKFMVPSNEIHSNIFERNDDKEISLNKSENEICSKNSSNCEITSSKDISEINKSKTKKLSRSKFNCPNTEIHLEETMTRSKRKKALENQIANSKILRNDKIIKYIYNDRTKKQNGKKHLRNITTSRFKSETGKKNITNKNNMSPHSSASSIELEPETVSDRLRPRRLSTDNTKNCKRNCKSVKTIKENMYDKKKNKLSTTHVKSNIFKKKVDQERIQKYNTSKFPPGWEDQVYEYKKSLKVPLRLITIKGAHNHRISTSLPDLDSHSSDDAVENCSVEPNQKLNSYKNDTKPILEPILINNGKSKKKLIHELSDKDNDYIIDALPQKNSPPKSIIDVLHSRVISSKKLDKKKVKTINKYEPKVLPRSTNELELLPTPNKTSESTDEHHNVFKTEVLKSRTRTETRNLKNKELIREVFGGEDRPASAPPEIRNADNKVITISFEEKYEQYLQKMNVDFGEKIRKNNQPMIIQSNEIENKEDLKLLIKKETIDDDDDSRFRTNEDIGNEYIKECKENSNIVMDQTLSIISENDGVVVPNLFKHKKNNKYRSGRRKGSSGFDYIRKKKKPPSAITSLSNQDNLRRKKISPVEFLHTRDENDVSKEIQKWVLNKSVGQSALHKAARLGYLDVIVYCLERMGMNPDPKDNAGYTPLHEACSKGRIDIARVLLQYGANHSETAHSGIRPLHEASENGYIEIVRLLLSYGADPLLTTYSGQTPLMLCESNEMEQFIKNHLYDVQNTGPHKQPWKFSGPWKIFDPFKYGYNVLNGAPDFEESCEIDSFDKSDKSFENENKSLAVDIIKNKFILNSSCNADEKIKVNSSVALDDGEIFQLEEADLPLPPLYLLKDEGSAKWVLLSDLCNLLKVKSKDTLLKQICPSTPPSTINKELLRELKMSDFLEKATCLQLLCAGEKLNIRASKVILVKYNERVQTLLGVKTVVMRF